MKIKNIIAALLGFWAVVNTGCVSLSPEFQDKIFKEMERWAEKQKDKNPDFQGDNTKENEVIVAEAPPEFPKDEVEFSQLKFKYGGKTVGNGTVVTDCYFTNLKCDGKNLTYKFVGSLATSMSPGNSHGNPNALVYIFIQRADGSWEGGKFDWISTDRESRGLGHLTSYSNWGEVLPLPKGTKVAMLITSEDGKRRLSIRIAIVK